MFTSSLSKTNIQFRDDDVRQQYIKVEVYCYKNTFTKVLSTHLLLFKESLNSDGDQFHQYQQNEQSLLIATELTEHNDNTTYDVGNTCLGLGQARISDPTPPLSINNDNTNINKR